MRRVPFLICKFFLNSKKTIAILDKKVYYIVMVYRLPAKKGEQDAQTRFGWADRANICIVI